ncbi:HAMP domain-containing protein [Haloglycomyces albus]|uniref:HAMP domain-containing protein n=1 Tax=Haloglycomyces albus TaxID=526067 RepID=UPI00046C9206|nr:HAMP domain-containing protein [Haloglycomyces albus]
MTEPTTTSTSQHEDVLESLAGALAQMEKGDFSIRLPRREGAEGEVIDRFNAVIEQVDRQKRDIQLISRVVGRDGRWTSRLDIEHLDGDWKLTEEYLNELIDQLVRPTWELSRVIQAVAEGDLSRVASLNYNGQELRGEFRHLGETVNGMVGFLGNFADEVTRVAREVGTEGKLGGQAEVVGASGVWQQLTESVNTMASNLTDQVRSISTVTQSIAAGDLNRRINIAARGEVAQLAETINSLTETLRIFAGEVTRVAREVGTEGRLGGQADVPGVAGTWKDLTDNVNSMASNLTTQVRNISSVATAVASGDLNRKITVAAQGEILELKNTVNTMVDQLSNFAAEVTRVAKEVGTEGKLGGQAQVFGVSGTWRDLTENVNQLARNLTDQVRNIAKVTEAVAQGDFSQKITVDASGEILGVKNTVNIMVDQLSSFADEVTRVAREVGSQGKLGGQANVKGVSGIWKDLTENVNLMASNLTAQVRNISDFATAVAKGDLDQQITVDAQGEMLRLKNTLNSMVNQLDKFADEVTRVAKEVGTDGKLGGQANVPGVSGIWKDLTENVNGMASNLTAQVRNISDFASTVAAGDLSGQITVDAQGEILELKNTLNSMAGQLSQFAFEVTRVAREVGTEGKLGGQANVPGVSGIWKDLTDNVNSMASNLTAQVRNISSVTTAVAAGDLTGQITVDAQGEILALKNTVNKMVNQLSGFADEVIRVAKEVGVEGNLGGQAKVTGASGTWLALTENVNSLAATLTTQLRGIANVAHAVARGDLTQSIDFPAAGEVADLTDSINQMIQALRQKTAENADADWLNSNLAQVSGQLQGHRNIEHVTAMILETVTPLIEAQTSSFYVRDEDVEGDVVYRLAAVYGRDEPRARQTIYQNEGLVGQAAASKRTILLNDIPEGYMDISSSLGSAPPKSLVILPVQFNDKVRGVIEMASFNEFSSLHRRFLDNLASNIGVALTTIHGNIRTELLLKESQRMAQELQQTAEQLQTTNADLEQQTKLLAKQNRTVEDKNREVEAARRDIEATADQLERASRYKTEFLANVSHELRTPLNSLLLLARLLAENPDNNLNEQQINFATTIYNAGSDLLSLIDDILDLSKIEAGRMDVSLHEVNLSDIFNDLEATFRPQVEDKGLDFGLSLDPRLPRYLTTDGQKLQQVLRNLLANAVKFTAEGSVSLEVSRLEHNPQPGVESLANAEHVYAFRVHDTGIGVPEDKHNSIFEPFRQAATGSGKQFGGTGLGLSISSSLSEMLGGAVYIEHTSEAGSTFTLLVPGISQRPAITAGDDNEALPTNAVTTDILTETDTTVQHNLEGMELLIVDDDIRNVFALTAALERHGLIVHHADNGRNGIEELREYPGTSMILMDSMMPVMDGNETTRTLRAMPEYAEIPIIFLSAQAHTEYHEKAREAGADGYLTKPVDLDQLFDTMNQFAPLERQNEQPDDTTEDPSEGDK